LQPAAANLREIMSSSIGADEVLMSGSGPTIAAYYKERNKAEEGMAKLSELTSDAEGVRLWFTDTGI
jgi:4-diphosphocytidyl-2-C-methyl-D-erythritol kinase